MDNIMNKYWNPAYETMKASEKQELQFRKFKEIFTYTYHNSPSYRRRYDEAKITPEDIISLNDIRKIPIVDKDFLTKSVQGTIFGETLTVDEKDVVFFHQTSGTTSESLKQADTLEDWYWNAECWASLLWNQGIRPKDIIMVAFNYNLFIGFWGAHYGCEKLGAEIISAGGLSSAQKLEKIKELNVNVLIMTPTYAFRLVEVAKKLGIDPSQLGIKKIVCAGEPGASIASVKNKLETLWGCDVYDHVGATEVGPWAYECSHKSGGVHVNESMFLVEIMDFNSEQIITEPNKYGRVVITSFYRHAAPCIRFNTNDIACWDERQCECGRTYRMIKGGVQGRVDYLIKYKGTFVNPAVIENVVMSDQRLSHEYVINMKDNMMDTDHLDIELVAEVEDTVKETEYASIQREISTKIFNATFLKFSVRLVPNNTLPRSEHKSKRVNKIR